MHSFNVRARDAAGNVSGASNIAAITLGGNLLVNGDFENGRFGWSLADGDGGSSEVVLAEKLAGNQALQIGVASGGDQFQHISTANTGQKMDGKSYTFMAYVKTKDIVGQGVQLRSYWIDASGAFIWENNETSSRLAGTNDWTKLQVTAAAPAGAYRAVLLIAPVEKNAQGTYWIDQASIYVC